MTVDRFMGPTFFEILNEIWTDFLRFGNVGGVDTPPHTPPNVRPCIQGTCIKKPDTFEIQTSPWVQNISNKSYHSCENLY